MNFGGTYNYGDGYIVLMNKYKRDDSSKFFFRQEKHALYFGKNEKQMLQKNLTHNKRT